MNIEDYVTAREAGKMLNVNRARIGVLCREGRFDGAKKIDLGWVIPRESVKNFKRLPPGLKPKYPRKKQDEIIIKEALEKNNEIKDGKQNDDTRKN